MKKILFVLIAGAIAFLCGCSTQTPSESKELPMVYGAELYNSSYIVIDKELEYKHVIPVMSKIDLSKAVDIQTEITGGNYDLRCIAEPMDYKLDGYSLYNVALYFTNVDIKEDTLTVKKISIYTDQTNKIELVPDKCELIMIDDKYNPENVIINGTPLEVPEDMQHFPLSISAENDSTITDIILTNSSLPITIYNGLDGKEYEKFVPTNINKGDGIKEINMCFEIDLSGINKYKHYGTSILIKYETNGSSYYTTPAVTTTVYNPFNPDFDSIEKYYNEVIKA